MKNTWNNIFIIKMELSLIGNNNDNKIKQTRKHKNKSIDINNKVFNKVVNTNNLKIYKIIKLFPINIIRIFIELNI